jgi:hypothetical protein
MILSQTFPDPDVNIALELLLRVLREQLSNALISVLVYGSILFDDLAPGYGDVDFLAVIDSHLDDSSRQQLIQARRPLRSGLYGVYCQMLEGAFLPSCMLDPSVSGAGLWWGTSGERPLDANELGAFVLHTIRTQAITVFGNDVRNRIPAIKRRDILEQLLKGCKETRRRARPGSLRCLDWLFTPARELLWLAEDRLSSKSEAADWGYRNAKGAWREHLPMARMVRMSPELASYRDVKEWLASLGPPIRAAQDELEQGLSLALRREFGTAGGKASHL